MSENSTSFLVKSDKKAFDLDHRHKINYNIAKYNAIVPVGKQQFIDLEGARQKAKNTKWKAIETLDKQLEAFESVLTKRGGKVLWAETAEDALNEVLKICHAKNCKSIVKSKSMVTEEIHLNKFLEEHNIESVITEPIGPLYVVS